MEVLVGNRWFRKTSAARTAPSEVSMDGVFPTFEVPEHTGETKALPAGESRFEVLKTLARVLVQGTNEPSRSHDDRESDPTRPQVRIRPDFWLPA